MQLHAEVVETHISWVLLTPQTVWKIKKPVRTAFLDYGTLAARRRCCEEEVRLNARLAPGLYEGVECITGTPERPILDGAGEPIEWAVRMQRFPDSALVGRRLADGQLTPAEVDGLADFIAGFHDAASSACPAPSFGSAQRRREVALAACEGASRALPAAQRQPLSAWLRDEAERLLPCWAARHEAGRVRECHGDLHLDNLLWLPTGPAAFDAIEFDEALRWTDVIDDIAFPVMDFSARSRADLGWRFLNRWLDRTGDHDALPCLRFAATYRALVRAQVALMRGDAAKARRYGETAWAWTQPGTPRLSLMHGLPGSGKTVVSQQRLERDGAIRLRSDVERKRLYGLGMFDDSLAAGARIYTPEAGQRTYAALLAKARTALQAGWPVILDAAFLRRHERDQARALAQGLKVGFEIVSCEAPLAVLRERVAGRRGDASEADVRALEVLAQAQEPLGEDERAATTVVHTG